MAERAGKERPDWAGPWRRDDRLACWWRPYRQVIALGAVIGGIRVVYDDGTVWA